MRLGELGPAHFGSTRDSRPKAKVSARCDGSAGCRRSLDRDVEVVRVHEGGEEAT